MSASHIPPIVLFDIDGVIRDVGGSYRRALADTVERFTESAYRPTPRDIDALKAEGLWNNDWEASQELIYRERQRTTGDRRQESSPLDYEAIVAFFQSRYRGSDPVNWTGYICHEPLLVDAEYFARLSAAGILWGFVSGATRLSATYVLQQRIGIAIPLLIAMEDAPGKPDPTGLLQAVSQIQSQHPAAIDSPLIYIGDTVADMQTVVNARVKLPGRKAIAVGVLPPHITADTSVLPIYRQQLLDTGATIVFSYTHEFTPEAIFNLL
jgi:HAD superfamily phosphatase